MKPETTVISFEVDSDICNAFEKIVKNKGQTVAESIVGYMKSVVQGGGSDKMDETDEIDPLTRLYNKNKFTQMISEYYPEKGRLGVVFWDVNGLKNISDTFGLDYGDYVVSTIAASVLKFTDEKTLAYRVGGDEFVMIAEGADENRLNEIIQRWQFDLDIKNRGGGVKFSAAVGYATGEGKSIEDVISKAKSEMNADKLLSKASLKSD